MASPSKEDSVLKLILENSPLKEWHFNEIVHEAKITKAIANKWLKKYVKHGILIRKKTKGKFPYFTVGAQNYNYYALKKTYALEKLNNCGLLSKLLSIESAKTIIIFGSMIKGDWYKDSDIDICIYGDIGSFNSTKYELLLKQKIELHTFKNKKEVNEVKTGLISNIINGYVVKGQINDLVRVTPSPS